MDADLVHREVDREGGLIGAGRGHGIKGVSNKDDPAKNRDFLAGEAEGRLEGVVSLGVLQERRCNLGIETIAGHGEAKLGMTIHQLPLVGTKRTWFGEYSGVEVDLADIVEHSGQGQTVEVDLAQADPGPEADCEIRDPVDVTMEVFDHVFHDLDQDVSW